MATLTCHECNYVNEGERVYCHNCGAKLDRSILPAAPESTPAAAQAEQRRVRRMVNPARGIFVGFGKTLFQTLVCAVLFASMIQTIRPPDHVPPFPTREELADTVPLSLALEDAMEKPAPQRLVFPAEAINRYLARTIKSKPASGAGTSIDFSRAYVKCEEGVARVTMEQAVFSYPLYATGFYQAAISNNRLITSNVGGAIGRMPVHPKIMAHADLIFQKLWEALSRERRLLDNQLALEIRKDAVVVTTLPRR